MPRIMVNGVVWSSAEDRILKVGVIRYGPNQWDRIVPLLPGKTVQQCEDRWKIGLTGVQWTQEQDARLLRLFIIMSNWHDIASVMRRSSIDCFNRHIFLSNQAQTREEDDEEVLDATKVIQGRVYRNPNADATRKVPDYTFSAAPEDMLSFTRARHARTQAKIRRRVAREKRLVATRRFAKNMRKQRERKQAKTRLEEMYERSFNVESENSTESPSCFYYSSADLVDPLREVFSEMQQRQSSQNEDTSEQEEQNLKRGHDDNNNFLEKLLGEDEPSPKRKKVLVLQEPSIDYADLNFCDPSKQQ